MALFGGREEYLAREALRRIDEHVKECKEVNSKIYSKIEAGYAALEMKFGEAHKENRKRLDAMVWASLVGALSVILFLVDKILTNKGVLM